MLSNPFDRMEYRREIVFLCVEYVYFKVKNVV